MKAHKILKLGVEIDSEDLDVLESCEWWFSDAGYVVTSVEGPTETLGLHILRKYGGVVPINFVIDHHDGNIKNNKKINLYIRTKRYNRLSTDKSDGVRVTTSGKFQARIGQQGLGSFNTYDEAKNVRATAVAKILSNEPYQSFYWIAERCKQTASRLGEY